MIIISLNLFMTSRNLSIKTDLKLAEARTTVLCANTHLKRLSQFMK